MSCSLEYQTVEKVQKPSNSVNIIHLDHKNRIIDNFFSLVYSVNRAANHSLVTSERTEETSKWSEGSLILLAFNIVPVLLTSFWGKRKLLLFLDCTISLPCNSFRTKLTGNFTSLLLLCCVASVSIANFCRTDKGTYIKNMTLLRR
jgi:hypothetical protein